MERELFLAHFRMPYSQKRLPAGMGLALSPEIRFSVCSAPVSTQVPRPIATFSPFLDSRKALTS